MVLDAIYYADAAWNLVKGNRVKKSWRAVLSREEKEISPEDDDSTDSHRKICKSG